MKGTRLGPLLSPSSVIWQPDRPWSVSNYVIRAHGSSFLTVSPHLTHARGAQGYVQCLDTSVGSPGNHINQVLIIVIYPTARHHLRLYTAMPARYPHANVVCPGLCQKGRINIHGARIPRGRLSTTAKRWHWPESHNLIKVIESTRCSALPECASEPNQRQSTKRANHHGQVLPDRWCSTSRDNTDRQTPTRQIITSLITHSKRLLIAKP